MPTFFRPPRPPRRRRRLFPASLVAGAPNTLTASPASFAVSAQDAGLPTRMAADAATLTLAGQDVLFRDNLSAGAGSFALSGQAVALSTGFIAAAASYSLSGQAANQAWAAAVASFTLSAQSINFLERFSAGAASYTLSGQAANQAWAASAASFTLTPQNATLWTAIGLIASSANFTYTPQLAFSAKSPDNPAEGALAEFATVEFPGAGQIQLGTAGISFNVTGQAAAFRPTMPLQVASYTLSGGTAGFALANGAASFTLTGGSLSFRGTLAAGAGAFTLSGGTAGQAWATGVASFSVTGIAAAYNFARNADAAAYALSAVDVHFLDIEQASFALSGQNTAGAFALISSAAGFTVSGISVEFLNVKLLSADAASYDLTGRDAFFGRRFASDPASFVLTGRDVGGLIDVLLSAAPYTLGGQSIALKVIGAIQTGVFMVEGWAVADIEGPSGDHIFLIEVQAHNGSEVETIYLATSGFTQAPTDTPANQFWRPRVKEPGYFVQSIGLPGEDDISASAGDVEFIMSDPGNGEVLDDFFLKSFGGRPIVIRALPVGAKSLSRATTLFRGRAGALRSTNPLDTAQLTITNKLSDLDKPLLTARFAGTTLSGLDNTAEGNADLAGTIKQQCWGECTNVPVQPASPYKRAYLVSRVTAYSQLVSIALKDGGLALTYDGDDADIATLYAATIAAGHYRTCLAEGLVRVGATPVKVLTADVVEGTTSADRSAAQIVKRMLLQFGVALADLATGSFSDLDAKNDAVCYSFVPDERTVLSEIQIILNSIGGRMLPNRNDLYEVTRVEPPSSSPLLVFDIDTDNLQTNLQRLESKPPVKQVTLQWGRVHYVMRGADFDGAVTDEERARLGTELRVSATDVDAGVDAQFMDARTLSYETRLAYQADADTEAERILDMLKLPLAEYAVTLPLADAWAAIIGGSITLRHSRLGLQSGKDFAVLTRRDEYVNEAITFDRVWGYA